MKLALIPPVNLLEYTDATNYHLMLPQLLDNERYARFYRILCEDEDEFVILDNGLAENYFASNSEMISLAQEFRPDEVVIPDAMRDMLGNMKKCEEFLLEWQDAFVPGEYQPDLMFVCQGQHIGEFIATGVWALSQANIASIGIPRHALETCNDRRARIKIANALQSIPGWNKHIHFLGASPLWSSELLYAASYEETTQSWLRGMDTSMPFNYTYAKKTVAHSKSTATVNRPEGYFDLPKEVFDEITLQFNIRTMLNWAKP